MLLPSWIVAIVVGCSVSIFTVVGFVLQTTALRDPTSAEKYPKVGEVILSPMWVSGMILQIVTSVFGASVVYAIAPMSLTAPLSGWSVVMNMCLAPWCLNEKLHFFPDLPATTLILIGTVLTSSAGPHTESTSLKGLADVLPLASEPLFLNYMGVLLLSLLFCLAHQLKHKKTVEEESGNQFDTPNLFNIVLPAWTAAGVGSITNMGLKIFAELGSTSGSRLQAVMALAFFVAPPAVLQLQAVNRGLRLYPQTMFFPIYSSLLVLTNTLVAIVFFQEFRALMEPVRGVAFSAGVSLIMLGISLFGLRQPSTANTTLEKAELTKASELPENIGLEEENIGLEEA